MSSAKWRSFVPGVDEKTELRQGYFGASEAKCDYT